MRNRLSHIPPGPLHRIKLWAVWWQVNQFQLGFSQQPLFEQFGVVESHIVHDHNDFRMSPIGIENLLQMLLEALIVALLMKTQCDLSAGDVKGTHGRFSLTATLLTHSQWLASPATPGVGNGGSVG